MTVLSKGFLCFVFASHRVSGLGCWGSGFSMAWSLKVSRRKAQGLFAILWNFVPGFVLFAWGCGGWGGVGGGGGVVTPPKLKLPSVEIEDSRLMG